MNNSLRDALKQLRLSGLIATLDVRLQEARSSRLDYEEFLELLLQDELLVRQDRLIERRTRQASFRDRKTLEDFDWDFNRTVKKKQIYALATGRFVRESQGVLFLGPPGTGKSHICQAIGLLLIRQGYTVLYRSIFDAVRELKIDDELEGQSRVMTQYLKADLLILDDMGMKQLPRKSGELLFEIIMRRHERRSTIMTTNRPLQDWGKILGDVPAATAILDRFLEHAELIQITGKSYRLRNRRNKSNEKDNNPKTDKGEDQELTDE